MGFHWSLNDSKSPQVSRTLLSILGVLLFTFFQFYSVVTRDSKVDNLADYYYYSLIRAIHISVSR